MVVIMRGWLRPIALAVFALFTVYTILLYGRPAWLPAPRRPWDLAPSGTSEPNTGTPPPPSHPHRPPPPPPKAATTTAPSSKATSSPGSASSSSSFSSTIQVPTPDNATAHPIDRLIEDGRSTFQGLLEKRAYTLKQAAAMYRERRHRHPPPGFGEWYLAAHESDAVLVEDFFDRIYSDLAPFWGLDPATLRLMTNSQPELIRVRRSIVHYEGDENVAEQSEPPQPPPVWIGEWMHLIEEIAAAHNLPDVDIVLNVRNTTRLLVPWEQIGDYTQAEHKSRQMGKPADTVAHFSGLADADARRTNDAMPTGGRYEHSWIANDARGLWHHLAAACSPDSPARSSNLTTVSAKQPVAYPTTPNPLYTRDGYIANITAARDVCLQPYLRGMHSTLLDVAGSSSRDLVISHELMPMFSGRKLPQSNEIVFPATVYLVADENDENSGDDVARESGLSWAAKKPGFLWRGTAATANTPETNNYAFWPHLHRHRWVEMMTGATVDNVQHNESGAGPTFQLPEAAAVIYNVTAQRKQELGTFVNNHAFVGFVDETCPTERNETIGCPLATFDDVSATQQFDYRFVMDIDGDDDTRAQWRRLLLSTSLPFKASIYTEWLDDRLVPWVHYVPVDSSYMDIYGLIQYFGDADTEKSYPYRDQAAARIADESRRWAAAVLRRDDIRLYVWRLLLEYARVLDDDRDHLAFVGDLGGGWGATVGGIVGIIAALCIMAMVGFAIYLFCIKRLRRR